MKKSFVFILSASLFFGCATKQKVLFSNNASQTEMQSAHLVIQGGKSKDMDNYLQKELEAHNLSVTTGDANSASKADLLVKYNDSWYWDVVMYLRQLQVTIYDKSGNLLATGEWENSAFHQYPSAGRVVKGLMDEMFTKIKTVQRQSASVSQLN